ncbi:MAG: membrane protein insertion efficiency factor YidD [Candidatus Dojkabacteria bacterium]|nr:membrane protein insertion efficiency factor YidD [Candidatus Dojkabacteria bacterium]
MLRTIDNYLSILLILLIKIYQKILSFDNSFWSKYINIRVCLHKPTCSEYMIQAIQKYGLVKGVLLGLNRILRCHPYNKRNFIDDVP